MAAAKACEDIVEADKDHEHALVIARGTAALALAALRAAGVQIEEEGK